MRASTLLIISLGTLAGLWGQSPMAYADEAQEDPSKLFAHGMRLFEDGDHLGAAQAFERAYRLKPHFSVLCNIALCHERRSDFVLAVRYYQDCLGRGAKDGRNATKIQNSLDQVQARVAQLQVSSPGQGGKVFVDGREVGPAPQSVAVNPGSHVIEVRRPGARPASRTITTRGGEHVPLVLVPTAVTASTAVTAEKTDGSGVGRRRLSPWWFWGTAGATVALAVAATVFGVRTLKLQSDYEDNPTQQRLDEGQTSRLVTNILWGLTAASGAASTTLFFFTDFGGRAARESRRREVRAVVGVHGRF